MNWIDAVAATFLLCFGWFVGWVHRGIVEKRRRKAYAAAEYDAELEALGIPTVAAAKHWRDSWEEYKRHTIIGRAQWD